ncbi:site-specific integrase [Mycobacteroides salmoniphilum]|uniref:site-specific integrase n=1 Tax=Mycobacteroides salmoniphilum TaxID=404941 RepID=UPI0010EC1110|nr:site-specific integrase [Mycobacteroides salmoniphilum]TDZ95020.1 site-specific tyrosine recombinase XerC [Mycobacteroides salmoniphilum]
MGQHLSDRDWRLGYARLPSRFSEARSAEVANHPDIDARERTAGVRPRQPFLLRPDGQPDVDVLLYFKSPSFQCLAAETQSSYALDLRVFLSFLSTQDVDWRSTTGDDLADFEFWRRRDNRNPDRVGGSKFARELAAISKFYGWQRERGVVAKSPVVMMERRLRSGEMAVGPVLRPKSTRSYRVKWLTPKAYRRWRDVGLGGYSSDGTRDESWRGRNDGRNLAMADALWSSGLRLREGATLGLTEVPVVQSEAQYGRGRIGEAVAKGRGRDFWISGRAVNLIDNYRISTRREAVLRAHREGRYKELGDVNVITRIDDRRVAYYTTLQGQSGKVSLDSLDSNDRLDFFVDGDDGLEPWMIWLSESGLPLPYRSWEAIFATANARCRDLRVDIHCHPHMLRHSFALRMLIAIMYAHDRRMGITAEERREYRHLFGDPWVLVQTMLGHANIATTRDCYLEPVSGIQVELFLNDDPAEDSSVSDLITRIAQMSPQICDVKE